MGETFSGTMEQDGLGARVEPCPLKRIRDLLPESSGVHGLADETIADVGTHLVRLIEERGGTVCLADALEYVHYWRPDRRQALSWPPRRLSEDGTPVGLGREQAERLGRALASVPARAIERLVVFVESGEGRPDLAEAMSVNGDVPFAPSGTR